MVEADDLLLARHARIAHLHVGQQPLLRDEQQAIAEYNQSIAQYERVKGTLLRYNNILMAEAAAQMRD